MLLLGCLLHSLCRFLHWQLVLRLGVDAIFTAVVFVMVVVVIVAGEPHGGRRGAGTDSCFRDDVRAFIHAVLFVHMLQGDRVRAFWSG